MAIKPRPRREPTNDWQQLALWIEDAAQRVYEVMRLCVLFGQSPAEHARQTGVPRRTLCRQVERFDLVGMRSLFAPLDTVCEGGMKGDRAWPRMTHCAQTRT